MLAGDRVDWAPAAPFPMIVTGNLRSNNRGSVRENRDR